MQRVAEKAPGVGGVRSSMKTLTKAMAYENLNNTGQLTVEELHKAIEHFVPNTPRADVARVFERFDGDKTGEIDIRGVVQGVYSNAGVNVRCARAMAPDDRSRAPHPLVLFARRSHAGIPPPLARNGTRWR